MVGSVDEPCLACSCENFPVTIDIRPALLQTGEHTGGSHGDFERTPATAFGGRGIATAERATAFLRTVYGWMCAGLAITALLFLGLFVGQIALVLFLSARLDRLAPGIGVQLAAPRSAHAQGVAGLVQHRVDRRVRAGMHGRRDEPGFAAAPVRARDDLVGRNQGQGQPIALQQQVQLRSVGGIDQ